MSAAKSSRSTSTSSTTASSLRTSNGPERGFALEPMSVADFHRRVLAELAAARHRGRDPSRAERSRRRDPFAEDTVHAAYDRAAAHACWRALVQVDRVLRLFRTSFLGKASPVHFFWGSFDLAVTRFSGRAAPPHPGGIPAPSRRGHARGVFARGQQRRLLARQRRLPAGRLLFVRLPVAARLRRGPRRARGRALVERDGRVAAALRERARRRRSRRDRAALPRVDLPRRRRPGALGSGARLRASASRAGRGRSAEAPSRRPRDGPGPWRDSQWRGDCRAPRMPSTTNRQETSHGDDKTRMDRQGGRSGCPAHGGRLPGRRPER